MMATTYTTKSGDAWDLIAANVFGAGAEGLLDLLVVANPNQNHITIFEAGVVLVVPDLPADRSRPVNKPPWK